MSDAAFYAQIQSGMVTDFLNLLDKEYFNRTVFEMGPQVFTAPFVVRQLCDEAQSGSETLPSEMQDYFITNGPCSFTATFENEDDAAQVCHRLNLALVVKRGLGAMPE